MGIQARAARSPEPGKVPAPPAHHCVFPHLCSFTFVRTLRGHIISVRSKPVARLCPGEGVKLVKSGQPGGEAGLAETPVPASEGPWTSAGEMSTPELEMTLEFKTMFPRK